MSKDKNVFIIAESVIGSWAKDVVTFGFMLGVWLVNHRYMEGSWAIDFVVGFFVVCSAISKAKNNYYTVDEAYNKIKAMKNKRLK